VDIYKAANGCDSTRTLHLTVKPKSKTTIAATICEGENYAGHTTPGTHTDVYKAANGCDSIRTLHLIVNPKRVTSINKILCEGESYFAARKFQTITGVYYDTAKTYLGCDSIIVTNLTVNPIPLPDLGNDRGVCIGDTLMLNPGNFSSYLWQDGSRGQDFRTNKIGTYSVTVTNTFGCTSSDTMRLLGINPLPVNFLPDDTSLCKENILKVQVSGYISYNWNTGGNRWFVDITNSGKYKLDVIDRNGCKGSDSMNVIFQDNCVVIQIPNAFTPGNDGRNDRFTPFIPAPLPDYHFQVFNRWGQLVFETKDYKIGWDGMYQSKPQSPGTYVYLITFKDFDGRYMKKSGSLILIR
ncbi:MAG: T9SS type B sorting domain-containing protein, partial [Flavitalea sp.]